MTASQRTTIDELRSEIRQYHEHVSTPASKDPQDWGFKLLTHLAAVWKTAYQWHLGLTQELMANNCARLQGDTKELRELREGNALIREVLNR
jgi:hypothetical protein